MTEKNTENYLKEKSNSYITLTGYSSHKNIFGQIKNILVELYTPSEIFLFGSYAWGQPEKHSDIDICVIVPDSNEKQYQRIRKGQRALWSLPAPIDLLVYTADEFNSKKNNKSCLQYKILHDGVKIYETA